MAKKNKFGLEFSGFTEVLENYQKLGGDLKTITNKCLDFIPDIINPKLEADIAKHKQTGETSRSIATGEMVKWNGTTAGIKVGFKIGDGGLASIFLMYGTARHAPVNQYGTPKRAGAKDNPGMAPDRKLYNDIYGRAIRKQIGDKQQEILMQEIKKRLGG